MRIGSDSRWCGPWPNQSIRKVSNCSTEPKKETTPMTRNPNFPKFILGLIVLVVLFIGTMAITTAPRSTAQEKAQQAQAAPTVQPPPPSPPPAVDHVFEIEGNTTDDSAIGEDWNN